jgi:DNA-binding winged helix-turn-helix (wHTH) protein/TolB-like protein/Tfp pilus assembly protein PilF
VTETGSPTVIIALETAFVLGDFALGEWLVSPALNQIVRDGNSLRVEPKAMQVLVYLAEHPGVVSKDQLISAVWPEVFVSDDVLPGCISALRKALDDDARRPRVIETIHKRGYRLLQQAQPVGSNGDPERVKSAPHTSWWRRALAHRMQLALAITPLAALFIAVFAWAISQPRYSSIAVLPFVNASSNSGSQYLGDGIAEQVINDLSQLSTLRVMAWATVSHDRQQQLDARTVGRNLGVKAVLVTRFTREGDRIELQTELVDVRGGDHLWGHTYETNMSELPGLQGQLSRDIVSTLRLRLSRSEESKLLHRYSASPEAYELYLKGRFSWGTRTSQGLQQGIDYFQRAIRADPNYALAYAGLADCYNLLDDWGETPPRESFPKARAAANQALSLDPSLAEAHVSLAMVRGSYDWDWVGAEQEFKRAIELNPNYPVAHQWYGLMLASLGRFSEAEAEVKRAQQLDPLSPITNLAVAEVYAWERHFDQSIKQYKAVLALNPAFSGAYSNIANLYQRDHRYSEALSAIRRKWDLDGDPGFARQLERVYSSSGYPGVIREVLHHLLEQRSRGAYVDPTELAGLYAELGDEFDALGWVQKGYEEHSSGMQFLCVAPELESLRSTPQFRYWLRVVGLSPIEISPEGQQGE